MSGVPSRRARLLAAFVVSALVTSVCLATAGRTAAHTGHWIDSSWTTSPPTIDGAVAAGEWSDATAIDLSLIPGNQVLAYLIVKNDANFIYIAYDAIGDTTVDAGDVASISFDTDHDLVTSTGGEDEFIWGTGITNGQGHFTYDGFSWSEDCSPFDPLRPNHAGLTGAYGYGASDLSAADHQIYEIQIPLSLLAVSPVGVLGFMGASSPAPGLLDTNAGFNYSTWPVFLLGPPDLEGYGDLRLGAPSQPDDLDINPPSGFARGQSGTYVDYNLTVINRGTSIDVYEMTALAAWSVTLRDATGTSLLVDNDGDMLPDTGAINPGSSVDIVARVFVGTSGCDDAIVVGASSNNVNVFDVSLLRTCAVGAMLSPPHSDAGVDTDLPPNGLFDELQLTVNFDVAADDIYAIDVLLFDQAITTLITTSAAGGFFTVGPASLMASLSGLDIYNSGIDGPYYCDIMLMDGLGNTLDTGSHLTAAYLYTEFEPPGAALNPPHSDTGVDTDIPPNGLYDELRIGASITVTISGDYQASVDLWDQSGTWYITSGSNNAFLTPGPATITVPLVGVDIYNSGIDGPYMAVISLWDNMGNQLDLGFHTTQAYLSGDFDPPGAAAVLSPPHSDMGVDTSLPPNGFFDELQIGVGVIVGAIGVYEVQIDLWDQTATTWITYGSNTLFLPLGPNIVIVSLSGSDIYNHGIDGPYYCDIRLYDNMSSLLDSDSHLTSPYLHTEFEPPVAWLNPPHSDQGVDTDAPPNGLYDELRIGASITVMVAGDYLAYVNLYDQTGMTLITYGSFTSYLTPGPATITVPLAGREIFNSGINGPYMAQIWLMDDFGNTLDSDVHMTSAYLSTDFDPPSALFNPPHTDQGVDTDAPPDGLYNWLQIDVGVTVNQAGTYTIGGPLWDPGMNYVAGASTTVSLGIGSHVVPLQFLGREIFGSGYDGPYTTALQLSEGVNIIDTNMYTTGAYSHTEFQPPPAWFSPPHSDYGLDLTVPPDSLLEFLVVNASIYASAAGTYQADIVLWNSMQTVYITEGGVSADLGIGYSNVSVRLSGLDIRASGIDGPYLVDLMLSDAIGTLDTGTHFTNPYQATEFSPSGALFSPPHTDYTVDTDVPPSGGWDILALDVGVDAALADTYTVSGILIAPGSVFIDTDAVTQAFPLGVSTCTLQFDGRLIADTGISGMFRIFMVLTDRYGRQVDSGSHLAGPFDFTDFEPADTVPPVSTAGAVSYWKNTAPLDVPFDASDVAPTNGLASVTLFYRHSTDNSSWGLWTPYASQNVAGATASGSISFSFPSGAGYYEFQMIAVDAAGNQEPLGSAENQAAYLPIAELHFQPDTLPLTAGHQGTLTISPLSTDGQPARLEAPLVINLETWSPTGEYRTVGTSTAITTVTIPAGSASASVDYYDTAAGIWTLLGYTTGGAGGMGTANVIPASVASITVDPGAITVEVTQTQTFTAIVKDAYGNRMTGASITWDVGSSLGTVDATGTFTAGTVARSGTITARSDSIQGSADLILTPGPAAGIEVTPDSATIQSGTKVTIIAEVVDAYGNVVSAAAVAWTVSGPGTVSPGSGATTTVTANGAGTISVTAGLGSLSATATFTSADTGGGLSNMTIPGIAGSLIGGILIGFAVGWILHKRRNKPQQSVQMTAPPPPPADFPSAQPPMQYPVQPPTQPPGQPPS